MKSELLPPLIDENDPALRDLESPEALKKTQEIVERLVRERLDKLGITLDDEDLSKLQTHTSRLRLFSDQQKVFNSPELRPPVEVLSRFHRMLVTHRTHGQFWVKDIDGVKIPSILVSKKANSKGILLHECSHAADEIARWVVKDKIDRQVVFSPDSEQNETLLRDALLILDKIHYDNPRADIEQRTLGGLGVLMAAISLSGLAQERVKPELQKKMLILRVAMFFLLTKLFEKWVSAKYLQSLKEVMARETGDRISGKVVGVKEKLRNFFLGQ